MKYLKRMNESSNDDMKEYIEECFVDYIDDTNYNFSMIDDNWVSEGSIEIQLTIIDIPTDSRSYNDIDYLIAMSVDLNEFYSNIKVCCEKVNSKYPNRTSFTEKIETYDTSKYLTIEFNRI